MPAVQLYLKCTKFSNGSADLLLLTSVIEAPKGQFALCATAEEAQQVVISRFSSSGRDLALEGPLGDMFCILKKGRKSGA